MSDSIFFKNDVVVEIEDPNKYIVLYDEHPIYWVARLGAYGYVPPPKKIVSDGSWMKVGRWSSSENMEMDDDA